MNGQVPAALAAVRLPAADAGTSEVAVAGRSYRHSAQQLRQYDPEATTICLTSMNTM
jgi:hypothetical protein